MIDEISHVLLFYIWTFDHRPPLQPNTSYSSHLCLNFRSHNISYSSHLCLNFSCTSEEQLHLSLNFSSTSEEQLHVNEILQQTVKPTFSRRENSWINAMMLLIRELLEPTVSEIGWEESEDFSFFSKVWKSCKLFIIDSTHPFLALFSTFIT